MTVISSGRRRASVLIYPESSKTERDKVGSSNAIYVCVCVCACALTVHSARCEWIFHSFRSRPPASPTCPISFYERGDGRLYLRWPVVQLQLPLPLPLLLLLLVSGPSPGTSGWRRWHLAGRAFTSSIRINYSVLPARNPIIATATQVRRGPRRRFGPILKSKDLRIPVRGCAGVRREDARNKIQTRAFARPYRTS